VLKIRFSARIVYKITLLSFDYTLQFTPQIESIIKYNYFKKYWEFLFLIFVSTKLQIRSNLLSETTPKVKDQSTF